MRKAIIENARVIKILELQEVRGLKFPLGQFMWDCSDDDVIVGDEFSEGKFTRNGKPVGAYVGNSALNEKSEAAKKEISLLKAQNKALSDRNNFTDDCIAEMAMKIYG